MQTLLQFVEAVAWPAALIFLALQFQREIVELCLRYARGRSRVGAPPETETGELHVDVDRVRKWLRETRGAELPDEELSKRVAESVMTAEELSQLRALAAAGESANSSGSEETADRHALASLVARGYVWQDAEGRYKLSRSGEGLVRSLG